MVASSRKLPRHPAILASYAVLTLCRDHPTIVGAFVVGGSAVAQVRRTAVVVSPPSTSTSSWSPIRRGASSSSSIVATHRLAMGDSPDGIAAAEDGFGTMSTTAADVVPDPSSVATTTVESLSSPRILDNYDTFLLDMWGVLHDGRSPYEGVLHAVRKLKEAGKRLIILSNSSKRKEDSEAMLARLGFDPSDFHDIITSGDVAHGLLRGDAGVGCENWHVLDDLIKRGRRNVFVFGSGDDDGGYCASAGWTPSSIENADLILARGTFVIDDGSGTIISKDVDEALYWEVMERSMIVASRRKLPMLVCNPDKVRPDPVNRTPMPGAIGDTYERFVWTTNCHPVGDMSEEGARAYVRRIGKPFREVYDIALASSSSSRDNDEEENGHRSRRRVIMIGDALETDVVGGNDAGIDVLWIVNDGIHGVNVREGGVDGTLERFNRNTEYTYAYGNKVIPRYVADHFRW
ncbi:hypothetical protein ACHAXA_008113 [Cyclostephanos tholiformis]|uniref:Uncharacterized protein n=1 Tax=Cyclostephanos tholiformis TaxID=382380 RepID=A0ABD3SFA4_9STRA